jgi:hypothetical protein
MWVLYEIKIDFKASRVSDWKVVDMFNYDESMIKFVRGFVTPEEVQTLNEYLDSMPFESIKDVFYVDKISVEHDRQREIEDLAVREVIHNLNNKILDNITNTYFPDRGLEVLEHEWTRGLELVRWKEFCVLAPHSDGLDTPPLEPKFNIGSLIYLNDDYDGGEIKFNDYDLVFKPEIGDLVIFPNHYIHEVLLVKPKNNNTRRHTMPVFYSFNVKEK